MRNILLALLILSGFAQAEIPPEKMKEFLAAGAVVSFDELCLKIYNDKEKSDQWMKSYEHRENKTKSADPYREHSNDRVFLVGNQLGQFVVTFGEDNLCSIYGVGVDRDIVDNHLQKLMSGYAQSWGTKFEKTDESVKGNMTEISYVANIPGTDNPIQAITSAYWNVKGDQNNLVKLSGVSLKRIQTSNKSKQKDAQ